MTCLKFKPADMKHRVKVQAASRVSDGQGGFTETWDTTATLWAKVEPVKGWEKMQAQQLQTQLTHKVTVRYSASVTTAKRLLFEGRVLDVKEAVNLDEANAFLRLMCVEVARLIINSPWRNITINWEDITELWGPSHGFDAIATNWNDLTTNWENMV